MSARRPRVCASEPAGRGLRYRARVRSAGRTAKAVRLAVIAGALAVIAAGAVQTSAAGGAAGGAKRPPNFLLIMTDDQAQNTFKRAYMPRTFSRIVHRGTLFRNGVAAPPLCCPDRAGVLTGQYPHNHGVFSNDPGYPSLRDPGDTLPVWLDRAGYRTGLVGKFLNHYTDVAGASPAPGFDRWFGMMGFPGYYDYNVSSNGRIVHFGKRRRDYSTDVLTRKANAFLRRTSHSSDPFFLWLAYEAPHAWQSPIRPCRGASSAAPPDRASIRAVEHVPLPRPPSFNERDVSDKPAAIRDLPRLDHAAIGKIKRDWHCALAAVGELDKGVGRVMRALKRDGEARNTIVVYVSDNGYFFGEHRRPTGKSDVYEPALNVPFAVKVPSAYRQGSRVRRSGQVVSNQDIAATFVDYADRYLEDVPTCAGAGDCRRMDGRSFASLAGGPGRWPAGRGVLAEIDADAHRYRAIRTPRYTYSELATGERELYDLKHDPYELRNRARSPRYARIQQRLAARLAQLSSCSGIQGRDRRGTRPFCE
jgi:N-acetylglucosamine-6-sulfatase